MRKLRKAEVIQGALVNSDVRIVFLHFESNRIVFAVLKSRDVKFVFIFKRKLQLLKFELNSKFVCVLDPEQHEINFVHYFLHSVCVMDHPSCATGPASQRLWLCVAVAELRWFF